MFRKTSAQCIYCIVSDAAALSIERDDLASPIPIQGPKVQFDEQHGKALTKQDPSPFAIQYQVRSTKLRDDEKGITGRHKLRCHRVT